MTAALPLTFPAIAVHLLACSFPSSQITVELKNDLAIKGTLHSVDQYLNIKLQNTQVTTAVTRILACCSCSHAFDADLPATMDGAGPATEMQPEL